MNTKLRNVKLIETYMIMQFTKTEQGFITWAI